MPKVSVVMASYNHEKFVTETIQSVLDQTYEDFEFIITDDGSSDKTLDIIKKNDDRRISISSFSQNQGACTAINNCINNATGEYIAVINSDDSWLPKKLEKQVNFLDKYPEIGAVFTYAQIMDEDSNDFPDKDHFYQKVFIQPNRNRFEWLKHFFFAGNCLCHPSVLIRKQCYQVTGVYDERYAQLPDWDFWIRLCMKYDIHIIPEKLTKFRLRANEANTSGNRPEVATRTTLEISQVLRNYLNPLVIEDFLKIFPLVTNIPEVGINANIGEIERELVPFFMAKMALRSENPGHKYFGFDLLYGMCSNPEIAEKLKNKYLFDFNNLTELASQQDIFGIIFSKEINENYNKTKIELEKTRSELTQSQSELKQAEMLMQQSEILLTQYHQQIQEDETALKNHQQVRSELEKSQAELIAIQTELQQSKQENNQILSLLDKSQSQLHQAEAIIEKFNNELLITQSNLEKSQVQLFNQQEKQQILSLLEQSQIQLRETEMVVEASKCQLQQARLESENLETQLINQQEEKQQILSLLEQSQYQLRQTEILVLEHQSQLEKNQEELNKSNKELNENTKILDEYKRLSAEKDVALQASNNHLDEMTEILKKCVDRLESQDTVLKQLNRQMESLEVENQKLKEQLNSQQKEFLKLNENLESITSEFHQKHFELYTTKKQLYKLKLEVFLEMDNTNSPREIQYRLLVCDAWYAYEYGDYGQMVKSLQQSFQYTLLSRTETMLNWLESFASFSSEKGAGFDSSKLLEMSEWQQLTRQSRVSKVSYNN